MRSGELTGNDTGGATAKAQVSALQPIARMNGPYAHGSIL